MKKILVVGLLGACGLAGQVVRAHYGQYVVDAEMSAHPELQKMGIHVIAPGEQDELIVACSVPSKIGKKSSAADLEQEKSGETFGQDAEEGKVFDLKVIVADAKKRPIGALVMEIRYAGASTSEEATRKAEAIRDEMQARIDSLEALF